ncbi:MAG: efflux RND transporter periplasmic adaptor subunit [Verrucomicrobia bacterium]|nr:efflux RND transporter periplasmic adaptor subunit [Verrucomicrobiota bacterium]
MNASHKAALPILCALVVAATGCGKNHESARKPLPSLEVRVQTIDKKPHVATEEVVATVNSRLRSVIESKVSGRIDKMLVTPGQQVKAGELLAELDVREIRAKLDQATPVREQAEKDLKRFTDLLAKRVITQQEFEGAESKARVARAAVIEAETMLGYAKVTAPFDGLITRKLADVGDLASPGKPLVEMEDPSALRLEAAVPEAIIDRITLGSKLGVRIGSNELEGVVREISPTADPNSRTLLVKLDLPAMPGLRTGQFGRVAVPVAETSVLRVPASAIIRRGQMELVFIRDGGNARLRIVKTGKLIGGEIEIVSGVNSGEQVIIEGAAGLVDGQPIEARP